MSAFKKLSEVNCPIVGFIVQTNRSTHIGVRLPEGIDKDDPEVIKAMVAAHAATSACYREVIAARVHVRENELLPGPAQ